MKIRNLLVLMITVALTTLCVSAQEGDGNVTVSDYSNQGLTITSFGTVVRYKNKNAKVTEHNHTYKICTCGKKPRCIELNSPTEPAAATLKVEFPKPGIQLKKGESLKAVATVKLGGVTLTRRLQWLAGSSIVYVMEAVTTDKTNVCSIEERGLVMLSDSCSMPPPSKRASALLKCPPPTWAPTWLYKSVAFGEGHLVSYSMDLSRVATVEP